VKITNDNVDKYLGQPMTCSIGGKDNVPCIVKKDRSGYVILQDVKGGSQNYQAKDTIYSKGYWTSGLSYYYVKFDTYITVAKSKDVPEWFTGQPTLVLVDSSDKYMALIGYDSNNGYEYLCCSIRGYDRLIEKLLKGEKQLRWCEINQDSGLWHESVSPAVIKSVSEVKAEITITTDGVEKKVELTQEQLDTLGIK
jgi:hypothetical protein